MPLMTFHNTLLICKTFGDAVAMPWDLLECHGSAVGAPRARWGDTVNLVFDGGVCNTF